LAYIVAEWKLSTTVKTKAHSILVLQEQIEALSKLGFDQQAKAYMAHTEADEADEPVGDAVGDVARRRLCHSCSSQLVGAR
jgi:Holliday junction resolvasome RuvABC DNA-binding subunit